MNLIIFGPPGVGKGTQSKIIAEKLSIAHISTGDIFRSQIKAGNQEIIQYVEKGLLVPDEVVNKVVQNELSHERYQQGFILDGYPRTVDQAKFLENVLKDLNMKISNVINLDAPEEILSKRLLKRAEIEGRKDDNPETIKKRIEVYHKETAPVLKYFKDEGLVLDIDGTKTVEEVFEDVSKGLKR